MNYEAKINDIESELNRLKGREISATGEEKILLNQRIIELEKKSNSYLELFKQQNARQGNC